jgi:hypothetical protein
MDRSPKGRNTLIALMMEAARTSETLVNFYQTTRRYNPEDSHLRTHRRKNLKSYLGITLSCFSTPRKHLPQQLLSTFTCSQRSAISPYSMPEESNPHPIYFITLLSMPWSSKWSLPFRFPDYNVACISHLLHACYMPLSSYPL